MLLESGMVPTLTKTQENIHKDKHRNKHLYNKKSIPVNEVNSNFHKKAR